MGILPGLEWDLGLRIMFMPQQVGFRERWADQLINRYIPLIQAAELPGATPLLSKRFNN